MDEKNEKFIKLKNKTVNYFYLLFKLILYIYLIVTNVNIKRLCWENVRKNKEESIKEKI